MASSLLTLARMGALSCVFAILVFAILVFASTACSTDEISEVESPVLLIGVDGLEWRIILEMIGDGQLPVLERLMTKT